MNSENLQSFIILNPTDTISNQEELSPVATKSFSLVYKKKLADRVENLKSKKHFKEIFRIIYNSSSNSYTKDNTGIYINFNSLDNQTIQLVENYLNNITPKVDPIPLPTKYTPYFSDDFTPKDSGIKLSNHEKNFLKYVGNDSESKNNYSESKNNYSESKNNYLESDSSLKTSEQNKTKIIIKPFTFE
jgi:hypothetical protein